MAMSISLDQAYNNGLLNDEGIRKRNLYIAGEITSFLLAIATLGVLIYGAVNSNLSYIAFCCCVISPIGIGAPLIILGTFLGDQIYHQLSLEEQQKHLKSCQKEDKISGEAEPKNSKSCSEAIKRIFNSLFSPKVEPYSTDAL